jgi:hypothetical protein
MSAVKMAYQTRFSIPIQLDTPPRPWFSQSIPNQIHTQRQASYVNIPVAKVLANFETKADQLRQFYDSTHHQVKFYIRKILLFSKL